MQLSCTKSLLRPGPSVSFHAQLVLAIGSHQGTIAPLQSGFYLIGRHQECQIRPKSRSVSRRHCLLRVNENGIEGFDLESTSGTYINDKKVEPKSWFRLHSGDRVRFGKVLFEVGFKKAPESHDAQQAETTPGQTEAPADAPVAAATMDTGKAWQEVDVAELLQAADDEDRERRYDNIRSHITAPASDSGDALDSIQEDFETLATGSDSTDSIDVPAPKTETTAAKSSKPKKQKQKKEKHPKAPREKRSFSLPLPSFSFDDSNQVEQWKLVGAAIAAVVLIGYACWSGFSSFSGPDVRILRDL